MMNLTVKMSAVLVAISLSLLACAPANSKEVKGGLEMSAIDPRSAARAATAAARSGDYRLIAIRRYSIIVPGIPVESEEIEIKNGVRIIEGTSDHWRTSEERRLNQRAFAYAKLYNAKMLELRPRPANR